MSDLLIRLSAAEKIVAAIRTMIPPGEVLRASPGDALNANSSMAAVVALAHAEGALRGAIVEIRGKEDETG